MNQELLTYLEHFITEERKERFLQVISARTNHFTVAMEDVFQMHNTSAVVRTCEVFGVQQAHSIEGRFGKRLDAKIAMGAQKWVDVFRYNDTQSCIDALRVQGYQIVATTPHADTYLKIPMVGFTESLNISVAVAIVLQQLTDKLRRSQVAWQLTDEERLNTLINWTKKSIRNVKDVLKRYEELTAQK